MGPGICAAVSARPSVRSITMAKDTATTIPQFPKITADKRRRKPPDPGAALDDQRMLLVAIALFEELGLWPIQGRPPMLKGNCRLVATHKDLHSPSDHGHCVRLVDKKMLPNAVCVKHLRGLNALDYATLGSLAAKSQPTCCVNAQTISAPIASSQHTGAAAEGSARPAAAEGSARPAAPSSLQSMVNIDPSTTTYNVNRVRENNFSG